MSKTTGKFGEEFMRDIPRGVASRYLLWHW